MELHVAKSTKNLRVDGRPGPQGGHGANTEHNHDRHVVS